MSIPKSASFAHHSPNKLENTFVTHIQLLRPCMIFRLWYNFLDALTEPSATHLDTHNRTTDLCLSLANFREHDTVVFGHQFFLHQIQHFSYINIQDIYTHISILTHIQISIQCLYNVYDIYTAWFENLLSIQCMYVVNFPCFLYPSYKS